MQRLHGFLPDWLSPLTDWLLQPTVVAVVTVLSAVLFVLSLAGVPWMIARLPADYFARDEDGAPHSVIGNPRLRWALRVLRNLVGALLLLAGLVMLVLPGQGILTVVVSLFLLEIPGKRRLELRVVRRPRVLAALNALRRRAGRPPLNLD